MALTGKLTKKLVENFGAGRHGDGGGLYLVVDPSGARRWIVRVVVKGQKNKKGSLKRARLGLGGADIVTLNQARDRALEYRRMAKQGLNPRFNARQDICRRRNELAGSRSNWLPAVVALPKGEKARYETNRGEMKRNLGR